jgi:hypothetical protein
MKITSQILRHIIREEISTILSEGGLLSPELTSSTKISPKVVQDASKIYEKVIAAWNDFLVQNGKDPVRTVRPVGSTSYYIQDLALDPDDLADIYGSADDVYGDIDYLVEFPFPGDYDGDQTSRRKMENQIKREYGQLMEKFFNSPSAPKEVIKVSQPLLVIQLSDGGYVQVDTIITFPKYAGWMSGRYTPERGIKGYIIGNLYSALGDMLTLTIGTEGVMIRTQKGQRVGSRMRKGVSINVISTDPTRFLLDIAVHLVGNKNHDPLLVKHSGIVTSNLKISNFAKGIVGLAKTLETGKEIDSASNFLKALYRNYEVRLDNAVQKKLELASKKGYDISDKVKKLNHQNEMIKKSVKNVFFGV